MKELGGDHDLSELVVQIPASLPYGTLEPAIEAEFISTFRDKVHGQPLHAGNTVAKSTDGLLLATVTGTHGAEVATLFLTPSVGFGGLLGDMPGDMPFRVDCVGAEEGTVHDVEVKRVIERMLTRLRVFYSRHQAF